MKYVLFWENMTQIDWLSFCYPCVKGFVCLENNSPRRKEVKNVFFCCCFESTFLVAGAKNVGLVGEDNDEEEKKGMRMRRSRESRSKPIFQRGFARMHRSTVANGFQIIRCNLKWELFHTSWHTIRPEMAQRANNTN